MSRADYIREISVRFYKAVTATASASADRCTTVGLADRRLVVWGLQVLNKSGGTRTVYFVDAQSGNALGIIEIADESYWPQERSDPENPDFELESVGASGGVALYCYTDNVGGVTVFGFEAWIP